MVVIILGRLLVHGRQSFVVAAVFFFLWPKVDVRKTYRSIRHGSGEGWVECGNRLLCKKTCVDAPELNQM